MSKNYDKIAQIEKAIGKKYGEETIKNPLSSWNEEKEKDYVDQIKEEFKNQKNTLATSKEYYEGFFVDKKLFNKDNSSACPVCEKYSFSIGDDVYLNKWDCCRGCYIEWVEDREDRWKEGWRPEVEVNNDK